MRRTGARIWRRRIAATFTLLRRHAAHDATKSMLMRRCVVRLSRHTMSHCWGRWAALARHAAAHDVAKSALVRRCLVRLSRHAVSRCWGRWAALARHAAAHDVAKTALMRRCVARLTRRTVSSSWGRWKHCISKLVADEQNTAALELSESKSSSILKALAESMLRAAQSSPRRPPLPPRRPPPPPPVRNSYKAARLIFLFFAVSERAVSVPL